MGPHAWSQVPEENQTSDPRGLVQKNWPAKAMGPAVRGLMATAACARDDGLGTLVATLGANNVYSVGTNEGLIDPDTQINGQSPAITKPFLLRLTFNVALAGSAANIPHLKVDNFDCGPIVNNGGNAIADGDLTTKRPLLVLGDMAASTDTKVTRVRVLDLLPSDLAALGSGFPIGGILPFTGTNIPTGFIVANGALLSRASYPKLWAHAQASGIAADDGVWLNNFNYQGLYTNGDGSTTFRIPALNGLFLRALDYGRGIDPGRAIGAIQNDAFRSHGHGLTGGGLVIQLYGSGPQVYLAGSSDPNVGAHAVSISNTGDSETRPYNVAYPFLIRAY